MAEVIRAQDPYRHLVTTSTSLLGDTGLYALPQIDFAQLHFYAYPFVTDFPEYLPSLLASVSAPGKPVLAGEVGVDFRGPSETIARDPTGAGFHDALWAGIFTPSFGTGMSWWWDNVIDPLDLWFHLGPVARAVRGVAFDREGFVTGGALAHSDVRPLRAHALRGDRTALVWIRNAQHLWYPPLTGLDPTPIPDATLALDGLPDGTWDVRWIDAYGGPDPAPSAALVAGGSVTLAVPTFARDVALRMERR
jgi:hypothetical protein